MKQSLIRDKIIYLDGETTGVDVKKSDLIQISAIVEFDGIQVDTFNSYVRPQEETVIDPEALVLHGFKEIVVRAYPTINKTYNDLIEFLDKYIDRYNKKDKFWIVGYNVDFDVEFLRKFFLLNDNNFFGSYFWVPAIDVMDFAAWYLKDYRKDMENFRLYTIAHTLGLSVDEKRLHNSIYDVELTRDIFKIITE